MEFFGVFSTTNKGNDYLYVIVDKFSKMTIMIPCKKIIIAKRAVGLFSTLKFGFKGSSKPP